MSAKPPVTDDLQKKVEEVKQDADVQRALKQATPIERRKGPVARARDKFVIGTHLFLLMSGRVAYSGTFRQVACLNLHSRTQEDADE